MSGSLCQREVIEPLHHANLAAEFPPNYLDNDDPTKLLIMSSPPSLQTMDNDSHQAKWERFLDPEVLRPNLILASI